MATSTPSIVHVTSWLSRQGGGIPPVLWALAQETKQRGFPCSVFGLKDQWVEADCGGFGLPLVIGNVVGPKTLGFSPEMDGQLQTHLKPGGVVHSHGLWMYPGMAARRCAAKARCPLIISPHGMLEPWALKNSRWKKRLAARLFENENLRAADCLHALCPAEADHFRHHGLKNPIAVIPNGVRIDETSSPASPDVFDEKFPHVKGRHRILFLSRLHPKKGLENLLQAWRQMQADFKEWCIVIAGAGHPAYAQELRDAVTGFGLENSVVFLGAVYGEEKKRIFAGADVFVLPSFSEGFSMAILEAAAAGLPILLTPECNFPELAKAGAAIEISPDPSGIATGLRQMLRMSSQQRINMGRQGLELVKQSYTWPTVAGQMCDVYQWVQGSAPKPCCVI